MKSERIKSLTLTGMFAALIFLATWSIHAPVGLNGGYIHFGDALIYLAASMLPMPLAMAAASIGAGLSDLMSPGAAMWVLPTMIIKPLCCVPFTSKNEKLFGAQNVFAIIIAAAITITGYFLATAAISGGFAVAAAEVPFSLIQVAGSSVVYLGLAAALDRTKLKKTFALGGLR